MLHLTEYLNNIKLEIHYYANARIRELQLEALHSDKNLDFGYIYDQEIFSFDMSVFKDDLINRVKQDILSDNIVGVTEGSDEEDSILEEIDNYNGE